MVTDSNQFVLYVLAKFIAYTLWCAVGMKLLWSSERATNAQLMTAGVTGSAKKWSLATAYGFFRLLMGVFFGSVIWLVGTMVAASLWKAPQHDFITYLLVYVPVRWAEWTILAWIIARESAQKIGYGWRLGGIAISCLADIPIIAAAGWTLPLGRFFC
jgi:hypothetical protein